jgi:uncharacterized delta-60 repeat protein
LITKVIAMTRMFQIGVRRSEGQARGRRRGRLAARRALRPGAEGLEGRSLMAVVGIDPTFGYGGSVPMVFSPGSGSTSNYAYISQIARQDDGKVVAVGAYSSYTSDSGNSNDDLSSQDLFVYRFNADGTPDTTFGSNGLQHVAMKSGDTKLDSGGTDVAIQPDGKIVVLGSATDHYVPGQMNPTTIRDFVVARFNADGSLDTSFNSNGYKLIDFNTSDDPAEQLSDVTPSALALAPGGKIVAVGTITGPGTTSNNQYVPGSSDFAIARLNPDGSLDTSFDGDGKATVDFAAGSDNNDSASAVAVLADGKIVVAGSAQVDKQTNIVNNFPYTRVIDDFALARLNADGSLDTSFDGDGKLLIPFNFGGDNDDQAEALALLPGGQILVAGNANILAPKVGENGPTASVIALARLNADGSLDPSYHFGGKNFLAINPGGILYSGSASSLMAAGDGSVVLGGELDGPVGGNYATIAKFDPAGNLVNTYGYGGIALLPGGISSRLVAQPDGKFLYANYNTLTRSTAPPPAPEIVTATALTAGQGRNLRLTGVTLKLNTPINPLPASNPAAYQLTYGSGRGVRPIALAPISYDPATATLTLPLARAQNIRGNQPLTLRILAAGIIGPGSLILNNGQDQVLTIPTTPPPTA